MRGCRGQHLCHLVYWSIQPYCHSPPSSQTTDGRQMTIARPIRSVKKSRSLFDDQHQHYLLSFNSSFILNSLISSIQLCFVNNEAINNMNQWAVWYHDIINNISNMWFARGQQNINSSTTKHEFHINLKITWSHANCKHPISWTYRLVSTWHLSLVIIL